VLEFLFTPYLHSPGAIMTYDAKTRSLFSSDVFAAISEDWNLYASGNFFSSMNGFHQKYMPSNVILRRGLQQLWNYQIDRILPQHGSIIEGEDVAKAIEYLQCLPCGIDLM
jgi:flavorubredoxin